jgi:hypothetical protein
MVFRRGGSLHAMLYLVEESVHSRQIHRAPVAEHILSVTITSPHTFARLGHKSHTFQYPSIYLITGVVATGAVMCLIAVTATVTSSVIASHIL